MTNYKKSSEFKDKKFLFKGKGEPGNYTLLGVAKNLLKFVSPFYLKEYPLTDPRLNSFAGYSKRQQLPSTITITFPEGEIDPFGDGFGIMFDKQKKFGGSFLALILITCVLLAIDMQIKYLSIINF